MITPTFREERKLYKQGFKVVAGVDEAGRGSLAGPMVAAAVILEPKKRIRGVRDSKKLTEKRRNELFVEIVKNAITWGIGVIEADEIDRIGLTKANSQVLKKAVYALGCTPDHVLVDYFNLHDMDISTSSYTKGDQKIYSIAAASILAKVARDEIMKSLHNKYSEYGFHKHKGYGTKEHRDSIKEYGPSPVHRESFRLF